MKSYLQPAFLRDVIVHLEAIDRTFDCLYRGEMYEPSSR